MMSKKKWLVVLCIFIMYLLLGAAIFQLIESNEEDKRIKVEIDTKDAINNDLKKIKDNILRSNLTDLLESYCNKPIKDDYKPHRLWDFYHSLFFVITVVSTIGYGNLAPTTMFTRIFMIFYGLIGIPMNGIVMVTMGTYFGRSFTNLYKRWKNNRQQYDISRLGLISQIILYLVPGFAFFIFVPSGFMVLFESWPYDLAVYYCFVTLTTIGFGDYVAGVTNVNGFSVASYWSYKIFLLVWVIGGLGYVVMILGFITQALQSKKMKEIEQVIKNNIKKTPLRIRQELRSLLEEFLFLKIKPTYEEKILYYPRHISRSQSWPNINTKDVISNGVLRKRAFSECPHNLILDSPSESDVQSNYAQNSELLQKVVDALSVMEEQDSLTQIHAYDGFSDSQILSTEFGSKWSLKSQSLPPNPHEIPKRRAMSDVRNPAMKRLEDIQWTPNLSKKTRTLSVDEKPQNFLTRLKQKWLVSTSKNDDVEKNRRGSVFSTNDSYRYNRQTNKRPSILSLEQQESVLEQTSIADFIRALTVITTPETMLQVNNTPKRKLGTASLTPPDDTAPKTRRLAIRPNQTRRPSLIPTERTVSNERRFSLRPLHDTSPEEPNRALQRKFSKLLSVPTFSISPVQRQLNKKETIDGT